MKFLQSILRSLGFGPSTDEEEQNEGYMLADASNVFENAEAKGDNTAAEPAVEMPKPPELDMDAVRSIFNSVTEVFNASLPPFLAKTVDTAAQADYLYNSLEQSMRDYLTRLVDDARVFAEKEMRAQNHETVAELGRLRQEKQSLEAQRSSIKEQQLSADRRRRALADRVQDLEAQLEALEAEREQFQLENKSLLNKLKVAQVMAEESGEAHAPVAAAPDPEAEARAQAMEERIKELEAALELRDGQARTSQEMFNAIQHELVEERRKTEEARANLEKTLEELGSTRSSLDEATELLKGMDAISEQMKQVESAISKRDERIRSLQTKNRDLKKRLATAERHLLGTVAPTLPFADEGSSVLAEPAGNYGADESSATLGLDEDDFQPVEWLKSTPPAGTTIPSSLTQDEFGYQEPPRKPRAKESDSQLSLF